MKEKYAAGRAVGVWAPAVRPAALLSRGQIGPQLDARRPDELPRGLIIKNFARFCGKAW